MLGAGSYWGLSPRVRGNPGPLHAALAVLGSIPACAGEPSPRSHCARSARVYPRVCGGTLRQNSRSGSRSGLSPRVRGNHHVRGFPGPCGGSIPACAGEPMTGCRPRRPARVYPRVCGGTVPANARSQRVSGLSPRVRGNRSCRVGVRRGGGSIPACAGEPTTRRRRIASWRVYPRVCGGTLDGGGLGLRRGGLSPRVRGNPHAHRDPGRQRGSIPACAGEPAAAGTGRSEGRVYPRVCGGTGGDQYLFGAWHGLSPRVRGNPVRPGAPGDWRRSIPACAGEPTAAGTPACRCRVYPRVCGGTAQ